MKIITIAGRLTKDAEMKRSQSGDPILQFSVAVDDYSGREKSVLFFDCALFGKRAQSLEQHLGKGLCVTASGDFSVYANDSGKTYLKIRVNDIALQGGGNKSDNDPPRRSEQKQSRKPSAEGNMHNDFDDSDIPF